MAVNNTNEESDRIQNRPNNNSKIQECDVPEVVHEDVITGDDEKRFGLKTRTKSIKIVPPSDSSDRNSSDRDSSDSKSDSNTISSTSSSSSDFPSDDSVKDSEFLPERNIQKKRINYQFFSPQPGPSWAEDDPNEVEMQPSNTNIESPVLQTEQSQPPSINIQPSSVDSLVTVSSVEPQLPSRKRKCNPESWKKNKSKALKNSGQAYITMSKSKKQIEAKKIGPQI
ncbi:unnamed protein product [Chilo suppressalis]|uniref:Uncharacterized protein n=1 Tax=Chilo suppressalis TaxID=168631 RepID=A0ABN8APQ7_CHISP|nr:unnamed protein product [Chilo suppressalis]